ncbi:poly [ADP-ribose] polymerase 2 isoform X2 [Corythoichthys intestinalis]|uniref:poly [ADP-ribose] polymerase 2 isoform X2 n=1 Tax=Corythoichthys intestinalis TaxID=161448 RepID=UPI0025A5FDBF|nr:poly [ADP-ribose] polymerase 2 isoform X2 [Corythoichthys intestinalis]
MRRSTRISRSGTSPQEEESQSEKVWQWQGNEGQWETYSPSDCVLLNSAVASGETSVSLSLGSGTVYLVDLKKMVQVNTVTKYKRKIRSQMLTTVFPESSNNTGEDPSAPNGGPVEVEQEEEVKEEVEESEKPPIGSKRKRSGSQSSTTDKRLKEETQSEGGFHFHSRGCEDGGHEGQSSSGLGMQNQAWKVSSGQAHVYSEGVDVYDVMLNQTNLQFNNNKYYLIQLLEDDAAKVFSVWMRWGRVGKVGQSSLISCGGDLLKAKSFFKKKFFEKTKNVWDQKEVFEKVAGLYDMVYMDYNTSSKEEKQTPAAVEKAEKTSKLHIKVQSLLELICDVKAMEEVVLEMKFDTRKAPLGKLTVEQISAGYTALKRIEACLMRKDGGRDLVEACNQFYTRIPHDFGLKRPPLIRTEEELKKKIELLEALSDIQIAVKMVESSSDDDDELPLDRYYRSLNCLLEPLDPLSQEYNVIKKYLYSTHASTHNNYTMSVLDIFAVDRDGESSQFLSHIHNRMLLWHGSRLSNWVSILSQGLRIAPPEAPNTGSMFGKGIYFADMSSKSANYCFASDHNRVGLLLLCEVALGNSNELLNADYHANNLPEGKHSTKGIGRTGPDPQNFVTLNGITVPMGPGVKITPSVASSLLYNEYIVYNPAQTRMRYLLRVHFNYDDDCNW